MLTDARTTSAEVLKEAAAFTFRLNRHGRLILTPTHLVFASSGFPPFLLQKREQILLTDISECSLIRGVVSRSLQIRTEAGIWSYQLTRWGMTPLVQTRAYEEWIEAIKTAGGIAPGVPDTTIPAAGEWGLRRARLAAAVMLILWTSIVVGLVAGGMALAGMSPWTLVVAAASIGLPTSLAVVRLWRQDVSARPADREA